ncbi:uncharacterized protein LOC129378093 [Poeciliopsis prolifica]|uniref:uncharacterized protein LOC129378093 n=1 Tax=Poeciliopsis prolifica TaxID=188132 RepID=UPI0024145694|nr:uncharacterized protein LOC129378093 [Poeciliopsis prolifica]
MVCLLSVFSLAEATRSCWSCFLDKRLPSSLLAPLGATGIFCSSISSRKPQRSFDEMGCPEHKDHRNGLSDEQFAYRSNRSTEDAISSALHLSPVHLEKRNPHIRMLYWTSAQHSIRPSLRTWYANWSPWASMLHCATGCWTLNTGYPEGCVLSTVLFTLMTHNCRPRFNTNLIMKYAGDTTIMGLIQDNNEGNYRKQVQHLVDWCRIYNLLLNVDKTKEIIVDLRRSRPNHTPLLINDEAVEIVSSNKLLGVHITDNLSWTIHITSPVKKAQQRLHFLR